MRLPDHVGEFGGFRDNRMEYEIARSLIGAGDVAQGYFILSGLDRHIVERGDSKSRRILLPLVKAELRSIAPLPSIPSLCPTKRAVGVYATESLRDLDVGPSLATLLAPDGSVLDDSYVVWEGNTYRAMSRHVDFVGGQQMVLPSVSEGGLAEMAGLVSDGDLKVLILLLEPDDFREIDVLSLVRAGIRDNLDLRVTFRSASDYLADDSGWLPEHRRPRPVNEGLAVVAHPETKLEAMAWASDNADRLAEFGAIYATGTTGQWVRRFCRKSGPPVSCMKSGPKGGDEQITRLVLRNQLQHVVFFVDPMWAAPHHVAVISLLSNCVRRQLSLNLLLTERSASSWIAGIPA